MIREDTFVQSHRPYAVDLASLRMEEPRESGWVSCRITAVWFRRRSVGWGPEKHLVTAACVGELWDSQRPGPSDAAEFLARHDDGRYGGDCRSRWDGERFWSAIQDPGVQAADLELLKPMLDGYPACPAGYSGWWIFEKRG